MSNNNKSRPQDSATHVLPSNAFSSIILSGVAKHNSEEIDVQLNRGTPRANKPFIVKERGRPPKPPTPPPSQLPPPGNLTLHLKVGPKIGRGRVGRVYEASVVTDNSSAELAGMVLPELVLKISRRQDSKKLAREAYYYQEMECLQGVAIARCYGVYETIVPADWDFLPWKSDPLDASKRQYKSDSDISDSECEDSESDDYRPDQYSDYESDEDEDEEHDKKEKKEQTLDTETKDAERVEDEMDNDDYFDSDDEETPVPVDTPLAILILERLGERVPLGQPLPKGFKQHIYGLYHDIAELGVDHVDIRWQNILSVPRSPSTLPSLPSPFTGRKYKWRLVDFDRSYKTNRTAAHSYCYHVEYLSALLNGIPYGDAMEPWE
ncbi:unnamed protein product [Somion occarium]|uniref:Protein kinase domain-containing protein n=1 Tax=Somion occarium TaxID=3059160 RepID=A0ABP1CSY4_9APHY